MTYFKVRLRDSTTGERWDIFLMAKDSADARGQITAKLPKGVTVISIKKTH